MDLKRISLFIGSFILLLLTSACASITFNYTQSNLEKIVERGGPVIAAIEKFKLDNGHYPDDIKELIPKYLPKIPTTGIKPITFVPPIPIPIGEVEEEYLYLRYKEQDPHKDPVQNGYRLLVIVDPFSFILDDENMWKCLLYRSSKRYPWLREIPKERIGDWAVVVRPQFKFEGGNYVHFLSY